VLQMSVQIQTGQQHTYRNVPALSPYTSPPLRWVSFHTDVIDGQDGLPEPIMEERCSLLTNYIFSQRISLTNS
jgi:hypothetical protein